MLLWSHMLYVLHICIIVPLSSSLFCCFFQETIRRCELNVSDHKAFTLKYADVSRWLVNAEQKFAHCSNVAGSRAELEDCQDKVQVSVSTALFSQYFEAQSFTCSLDICDEKFFYGL